MIYDVLQPCKICRNAKCKSQEEGWSVSNGLAKSTQYMREPMTIGSWYIQSALVLHSTYGVLHVVKNNKITGILGLTMDDICFSVIQGLVSAFVYGILFYPFFACLTTKYKLIGSLMGFVYAAIRYEAVMLLLFWNQWVDLLIGMADDKLHSLCNNCKILFKNILDEHGKYILYLIFSKTLLLK